MQLKKIIVSVLCFLSSGLVWAQDLPINPAIGRATALPKTINTVRFDGASPQVLPLLMKWVNELLPVPVGEERGLASELTSRLRAGGYPVAQILYLPKDQLAGKSEIAVLRVYLGKIGKIEVKNNSSVDSDFLKEQITQALCGKSELTSENKECILFNDHLERATSLLKRNPGVEEVQVQLSRQGVNAGETGLLFIVAGNSEKAIAQLYADNYGVPSSGKSRYGFILGANSFFNAGDRVHINAQDTNKNLITGALNWLQPINGNGLNFSAQLARSQVTLPLGNSQLQSVAESVSLGLTHPFTLLMNKESVWQLDIGNSYVKVDLNGFGVIQNRQIPFVSTGISGNTGPISSSNYVAWLTKLTVGRPSDSANGVVAADTQTQQVLQTFGKLYSQIIRRQQLGESALSIGLNVRGQTVSRNVDPSMMLPFGGIDGARAYPVTEGAFSTGLAASADMTMMLYRGDADSFRLQTSIFSDYVAGQTYKNTWANWNAYQPTVQNDRQLYNYGMELVAGYGKFMGRLSYARKFSGSPQSIVSPTEANGRFWLLGSWSFN